MFLKFKISFTVKKISVSLLKVHKIFTFQTYNYKILSKYFQSMYLKSISRFL